MDEQEAGYDPDYAPDPDYAHYIFPLVGRAQSTLPAPASEPNVGSLTLPFAFTRPTNDVEGAF